MSVSTNAMLVYGYIWDDEASLLGEDEDVEQVDWVEVIANRRGLKNPWDDYPAPIQQTEMSYEQKRAFTDKWSDDHRHELDDWYAAKKAIEKEYDVEIDSHGSGEWSCPIVRISSVGVTARRGYPVDMTDCDLSANTEWIAKLEKFCTELGIDVSDAKGPGWFLASWWC